MLRFFDIISGKNIWIQHEISAGGKVLMKAILTAVKTKSFFFLTLLYRCRGELQRRNPYFFFIFLNGVKVIGLLWYSLGFCSILRQKVWKILLMTVGDLVKKNLIWWEKLNKCSFLSFSCSCRFTINRPVNLSFSTLKILIV